MMRALVFALLMAVSPLCVFAQGLAPFYMVHDIGQNKSEGNHLMLLNSGIASLQKRIDMIRKAKKSIILEYFIYEKDKSGRLLIDELVKKAKEGVEVRVLLDKSITIIELDDFFAEQIPEIQFAYYNRALDPYTAQFRTHRKILGIDGEELITGGRNIGDDYFDLSAEYNFFDRDVWIKGPMVKTIFESFDYFWNDKSVVKPSRDTTPGSYRHLFATTRNRERYRGFRSEMVKRNITQAKVWLDDKDFLPKLRKDVERVARPILDKSKVHLCPKLTYASDRSGGTLFTALGDDYKTGRRILQQEIMRRLKETGPSDHLIIETPYFMLNDKWREALGDLLNNDRQVTLISNSLASTDAFYVSANFYRIIFKLQEKGLIPFIHNSEFHNYSERLPVTDKARWGIHAKTHIYDEDSFMIGTYNIDNRSDFFNAEMAIFCDGNREMTDELRLDMQKRIDHSYKIVGDHKAIDKEGRDADVYAGASKKDIKLMKAIKIPSQLLEPLM
jgi:putative cardiolipin synthase